MTEPHGSSGSHLHGSYGTHPHGSYGPRDLVGYGPTRPDAAWPGGARIALSVVVNYEEGSELNPLHGDATHEMIGELPSTKPPGVRDLQIESQWEYGSRAGVWRLLRILEHHRTKATFFMCGMALEEYPQVGRAVAAAGHDISGHGHRWIEQWHLDPESERAYVARALDAIEGATGTRPLGWFTKNGPSPSTRRILAEAGLLYDNDALDDDLPYYARVDGRPWLVVPYALDTNDGKWWRGGWHDAEGFFRYLRDSFDVLYAEGEAGSPALLSVGLHPRVAGRPGRAAALERFLQYVGQHDGVWIAGRDDIARHWAEHHPAPGTDPRPAPVEPNTPVEPRTPVEETP